MITDKGKRHLIRLASRLNIGEYIALGVGATAATTADTGLDFETVRVPVTSAGIDYDNNRIILKAVVPAEFVGTFYEAGVYGADVAASSPTPDNPVFSATAAEGWSVAPTNTNSRFGNASITLSPNTNNVVTASTDRIQQDFSRYSAQDVFALAFNVTTAFTKDVEIRLGSGPDDYYQALTGVQSAGYKIARWTKGSMTVVGAPDWSNITYAEILVHANDAGSPTVSIDGLRVESGNTLTPSYILIQRSVLPSPVVKSAGVPMEVEFPLNISVGA